MNNRVLITSVGRKVSLVKEFKKAGWYVIGQDKNPDSIALRFCDSCFDSPDLIIPTRDEELFLYEGQFATPELKTLETCTDKFKFYEWCKANGFNTPEVYFVKPRISKSGKEVECVWQEVIKGEEYSIDLFAWGGKVISVVPRKRIKTANGESTITQTVKWEPLWLEAQAISQSLGLVGHNVLQCFLSNGKLVWTDVNCRYGGASVVGIRAGCQSPKWLLTIINGGTVEPCIGEYKVGLAGYSYTDWEFYEN